jgi:hypothetical protein
MGILNDSNTPNRMRIPWRSGLLLILVYSFAGGVLQAGSFTNGGFESTADPPIAAGTSAILNPGDTWLAGWSVGGLPQSIQVINGSWDGMAPYEGQQWILFNASGTVSGGSLSQAFNTTIGHSFSVTLFAANPGAASVSLAAVAQTAQGAVLSSNLVIPVTSDWTAYQFYFTATQTNATLVLTDTTSNANGGNLALDGVSLVDLGVVTPPVIVTNPESESASLGATVVLAASAGGGPSLAQWYLGTNAISGATNATLPLTVSLSTAGSYTVAFTNARGSVTSAPAVLSIAGRPFLNGSFEFITSAPIASGAGEVLDPGDQWLVGWTAGGPAGAIAVINGPGDFMGPYDGQQWVIFDGGNTPAGGSLSQTFDTPVGHTFNVTLFAAAPGYSSASIRATATSCDGNVLSSSQFFIASPSYVPPSWAPFTIYFTATSTNTTLVLTDTSTNIQTADLALDDVAVVDLGVIVPPAVSVLPLSQRIGFGASATFTATNSGGASLAQWYLGTNAIPGATNTILSVTATQATAGTYIVVLTNDAGNATSAPAILTVVGEPFYNGNFENFTGTPITSNSAVVLNPGDTRLLPWQIGGPVGAIQVANAATDGIGPSDGQQWIIYNGNETPSGGSLAQTFDTTIGHTFGVSLFIAQPGSGTMSLTAEVAASDLSLLASNLFIPASSAWTSNKFYFTATTSNATLILTDTSLDPHGGDLALDDVAVVDLGVLELPLIVVSPTNQVVQSGTQATLTASADGSPSQVQWYFGTNAIAGATNTTLTVTANLDTVGTYLAVFTNPRGSATSASALLTVTGHAFFNGSFEFVSTNAPVIPYANGVVYAPGDTWLTSWVAGGPSGCVALINGPGDLTAPYDGQQWVVLNGNNTPAGGSLSQTFDTTIGHSYNVTLALAAPGYGSMRLTAMVRSASGTVLANQSFFPSSITWGTNQFYFAATTTNTTLVLTDTSPNPTNGDLVLDDVTVEDIGVFAAPTIVTSPSSQTVNAGTQVTFTASATGDPSVVQWYRGTNAIPGATNATLALTASPATRGNYTAVFSNPGGTAASASAILTVIGNPFFNGSFEIVNTNAPGIPYGGGAVYAPGDTWLTSWVAGGPSGSVGLINGPGDYINPYEGQVWVMFNGGNTPAGGSLSQTFDTTIGHSYGVTLALAAPGNGNMSLTATAQSVSGTVLASQLFIPVSSSWITGQFYFTATTTNTTLVLTDTSPDPASGDLALDDVAVSDLGAIVAPVVVISPLSQTSHAGAPVSFTASASGSPSIVQWYQGANAIVAATNTTLTLTASPGARGGYTAVFSNPAGTATSASAILTVIGNPFFNGSFESINANAPVIPYGGGAVYAPGGTWLTSWIAGGPSGSVGLINGPGDYISPYDGQQWVILNGGNAPSGGSLSQTFDTTIGHSYGVTLALAAPGTGNMSLSAIVTASAGSLLISNQFVPTSGSWAQFQFHFTAITTNTTLLLRDTSSNPSGGDLALDDVTVIDLGVVHAPRIVSSPRSQSAFFGASVTFSASASGNPSSIQWYHGTNAIAGATNATLNVVANPVTAGSYSVKFSNYDGTAVSSPAVLTILGNIPFFNGSFEAINSLAPVLANGTVTTLNPGDLWLTDWYIGGPGHSLDVVNGTYYGMAPANGQNWILYNGYDPSQSGTLSQGFATTVGHTFSVNFDALKQGGGNPSFIAFAFASDGTVLVRSSAVPPNSAWTSFSIIFTAKTAITTLAFDFVPIPYGGALGLDNIAVVDLGAITPPAIVNSPRSQSARVGALVTFSASAGGTHPLVQWLHDGFPIPGATNTTLIVTAGQATAGTYRAEFSNVRGTATSAPAYLTVIGIPSFSNGSFESTSASPIATNNAVVLNPGDNWLTAWMAGGPEETVQVVNGSLDDIGPFDGHQWIKFDGLTNSAGGSLSQTFTTVVGHSYAVSLFAGAPGAGDMRLTAEALASDNSMLSSNQFIPPSPAWTQFQFYFVAKTSNSTLTLTDSSLTPQYGDLILDGVTVLDLGAITPPVIAASPASRRVNFGTSVSFTTSARGSPSSVQWYLGTNAIPGATNLTLNVTANPATAGSYRAVFSNVRGTATSAAAVLSLLNHPFFNGNFEFLNSPPVADGPATPLYPGATWLAAWAAGGPKGFVQVADGSVAGYGPYDREQWIYFTGTGTPGGSVSQTFDTTAGHSYGGSLVLRQFGEDNMKMTVAAMASGGSMLSSNSFIPPSPNWTPYQFFFTAKSASTTLLLAGTSPPSAYGNLGVDDVDVVDLGVVHPPVIVTSPRSQTADLGTSVTFTAAASGTSPSVQWFYGTNTIPGATNALLTVTATPAVSGSYRAVFSNAAGTATSATAILKILGHPFFNGSFEFITGPPIVATTGAVLNPGNQWLINWTAGGPQGAVQVINGSADYLNPYDGQQWIMFDGNGTPAGGSLAQSFDTTVGHSYAVTLFLARPGSGNSSLTAVALASNNLVLASNVFIPQTSDWTPFQFYFTAARTNTVLRFTDTSADVADGDLALDDVTVVDLGAINPPVITSSPASQSANFGASVTFSVSASGSPFVAHWYLGTNAIPGATNTTLAVMAHQNTAGSYIATVTNPRGTAASAAAILTVNGNPFFNGSFETIDLHASIPAGGGAVVAPGDFWLSSWTAGGPVGSVQIVNGDADNMPPQDGQQWVLFDAGNTPAGGSLSQTFATQSGHTYVVSLEAIGVNSATMSLSAVTIASDGAILASNVFSPAFSYPYFPAFNRWTPFQFYFTANTTNSTLILTDTSPNTEACDLGLDNVTLSDLGAVVPPAIVSAPVSQSAVAGTSVTFGAVASGSPSSVQWYFGTNAIVDATNNTLTVLADRATGGSYSAIFTNVAGTASSTSAILTVIGHLFFNGSFETLAPDAPNIPYANGVSLNTGDTWLTNWVPNSLGGNIGVINGPGDEIQPDDGNHWVIFNGGETPSGASLAQTFETPIGHSFSVSLDLAAPGQGSMSLTAAAMADNGATLASRVFVPSSSAWSSFEFFFTATTTNTTLLLTDTSPNPSGGDLTLDNVTVEDLGIVTPPVIVSSPLTQSVNLGATVTLSVSASGSPALVQWFRDGVALPGETNTSLIFTANQLSAGSYTVMLLNAAGTAVTPPAILTVLGNSFFNGSFEMTDFHAAIPSGTGSLLEPGDIWLASWTPGGPSDAIEVINGSADYASPYDGQQWVVFDPGRASTGGSLSQTFATMIGHNYRVTLAAIAVGEGTARLTTTALASDASTLASNVFAPALGTWTPFQFYFVATGTNSTLVFEDTSLNPVFADLGLDDIAVIDATLEPPPVITNSPLSQSANFGATVTLSAMADGIVSQIQWYFGTNLIAGATNATFSFTANPVTAGSYTAVFSNPGGSTTTSPAIVTLTGSGFFNGSFEFTTGMSIPVNSSMNLAPGDTWLTSWTVGGSGRNVALVNGPGDGLNPEDGNQWIVFNAGNNTPGGSLSQTFGTTAGANYTATLSLARSESYYGNEQLTVTALTSDGAFLARNVFAPTSSRWTAFQFNFTALTTNSTLIFTDSSTDTDDVDLGLDNITLLGPPQTPQVSLQFVAGRSASVIGSSPSLQVRLGLGTTPILTLFGDPGANVAIFSATNLTLPIQWTPLTIVSLTNPWQSIELALATNQMIFFRAELQ